MDMPETSPVPEVPTEAERAPQMGAERAPQMHPPRRAGDNTVFVGKKGTMGYVLAVVTQFNNGAKEVTVKARGKLISRAVDVVEIVRHRFMPNSSSRHKHIHRGARFGRRIDEQGLFDRDQDPEVVAWQGFWIRKASPSRCFSAPYSVSAGCHISRMMLIFFLLAMAPRDTSTR